MSIAILVCSSTNEQIVGFHALIDPPLNPRTFVRPSAHDEPLFRHHDGLRWEAVRKLGGGLTSHDQQMVNHWLITYGQSWLVVGKRYASHH